MSRGLLCPWAGLILATVCLGSALGNSPVYATEEQNEVRTWTASDGKYQTQARLVEIRPDEVVLEKTTGSRITVRRERLSQADRVYLDARQAATANPAKKPESAPASPAKKAEAAPADEALRREVRAELARVSEIPPAMKFEKIATLEGHTVRVAALAISSDGSRVITCAENGDCRAWDLKTGRQLAKFEKPLEGKSFCVAITPDGRRGLVGGESKMIHVWDTQTGKIIFSHGPGSAAPAHLATSADGRKMLGVTATGIVFCFPILGGPGPLGPFRPEATKVDHFAAALDASGEVLVYGEESAAELIVFPGPSSPGTRVRFALDFPRAASAAMSAHFIALGTNVGRLQLMAIPPVLQGPLCVESKYAGGPSRIAIIEHVAISSDEKWIVSANREGHVEIRDLAVPADDAGFRIPVIGATSIATGPDGMTLAFAHSKDKVGIWRLPKAPSLPKVKCLRMAFGYLDRRQYDRLDALAAELKGQDVPFSFWSHDSRYTFLVGCLARRPRALDPGRDHDQALKEWLERCPESTLAKLVLAERYIVTGWDARGRAYAASVTEEGWRVFHDNLGKAKALVLPLVSSPDAPGDAYRILLEVAKGEGWDRAQIMLYVDQMMRRAPAEFTGHLVAAETFMPRWGGAEGEPEAYARKIADRIGGAAGAAVYARIAMNLSGYHPPQDFPTVEKFDYPRIREGLAEICRQCPDDPEAVNGALKMAWIYRDKETAKQCVAKLESGGERWSFRYWTRNVDYWKVKDWATQ